MNKNVTSILGYLSIATISTFLLFSCKKSTDASLETDRQKEGTVYEYIKKLGYKENEIKEIGDEYLVDGDIAFNKNSQADFSIFDGLPVHRYYHSAHDDHFYTKNEITLAPGYNYEIVSWYAF